MKHILSIDVEEWYHGKVISRRTPPEDRFSQIEEALSPVLDLLERHAARATFFVVGDLLPKHPQLFTRIAESGHEIGCHGMSHTNLSDLGPESFAVEIDAFRRTLSSLLPGHEAIGFRAPMFSMTRRTAWAMPILKEAGYQYDSSIFPAYTGYYGVGYAPTGIYRASLTDPGRVDGEGGLLEVPLTVLSFGRLRIPVAGGTYLRLIPFVVLERMLRRVARKRPLVLYAHPFEFYPPTPRRPLHLHERFAVYHNIPHNLGKLERLLERFDFGPVREVLGIGEMAYTAS